MNSTPPCADPGNLLIHNHLQLLAFIKQFFATTCNSHVLLIDIQKAMMAAVRKVIFCLDHTKIGRQSLTQLCPSDIVVTDPAAPREIRQEALAYAIRVEQL